MDAESKDLLAEVVAWIEDGCPAEERDAALGTLLYVLG